MNFAKIKAAIMDRTFNGRIVIKSIVDADGGHVVVYDVNYARSSSRTPEQRVAYVTYPHYSVPFDMIASPERIVS